MPLRIVTLARSFGVFGAFMALLWLPSATAPANDRLLLAAEHHSVARSTTEERSAAGTSTRFHRGICWKIESSGVEASYLFGTIHSDDPRVTTLPAPIRNAFEKSDSFTMETVVNGADIVAMAEIMYFNDGRTLQQVIGAPLYARTKRAFVERGLPTDDLSRKKPWTAIMALSVPTPKTGMFLDLTLQMQATLQGKRVHELESLSEQLAVFDNIPIADQIALLEQTLAVYREIDAQTEKLIQAYNARDLKKLMAIVHELRPADASAYDEFMARLLTQRNLRMFERMQSRLLEGKAFIAVGAAHLPGADGLLTLLAQHGYRLTPIY